MSDAQAEFEARMAAKAAKEDAAAILAEEQDRANRQREADAERAEDAQNEQEQAKTDKDIKQNFDPENILQLLRVVEDEAREGFVLVRGLTEERQGVKPGDIDHIENMLFHLLRMMQTLMFVQLGSLRGTRRQLVATIEAQNRPGGRALQKMRRKIEQKLTR